MNDLPSQPRIMNGIADTNRNARPFAFIIPALFASDFLLALAGKLEAQTITIYNDTNQDFPLNPVIATTCTPPGTQQLGCIGLPANGSNSYTPPSGYICYGFKISCGTSCTVSPEGSVSCAGQGRPFDCSGNTYVGDFSGSEVRIND